MSWKMEYLLILLPSTFTYLLPAQAPCRPGNYDQMQASTAEGFIQQINGLTMPY